MRLLFFTFLYLGVYFPFGACADETKMNVGFIAALSGPAQAYGEAAKNGFELALHETTDQTILVKYEDDQFVPAKTIAAFNKLTQVDAVNVVVCVGSATCNAIAPLAEARHIALIGWASDPQVSKNRKFVIRSYPSGQDEGKRSGEEAIKRDFSKIGIVSTIHDYRISWRVGLLATLPTTSIVLDEQVPPDMQDFRALLSKARQKGVENFVVCLLPGQVGVFAKQSHEMGLKPKIGGCEFLEDENEAKVANGALGNAWYIVASISPAFVTEYRQKYGNENTITAAAIHYDLYKLLAVVAKEKNVTDIAKAMMDIGQFQGAAGPLVMRNENGDQFFDYELIAKEVPAK